MFVCVFVIVNSDVMKDRLNPLHRMQHPDGKIEQLFDDGSKLLVFPNGTEKCIFINLYDPSVPTKMHKQVYVKFANRDVKKILCDGTEVYYYASNDITHVTQTNGVQLFYFANTQHEIHFTDKTKHIMFADGTKKYIYPNGEERCVFPNGSIQNTKSKLHV